jgi:PLP dependent protein
MAPPSSPPDEVDLAKRAGRATLEPMSKQAIRQNLETVRGEIAEAARRSGRDPGSVMLVAVTKRSSPERVRQLVELGASELGENYPQELWRKAEALADLPVRWHLIGHLQGNKARATFPLVRMIHAVDSPKLLRALDEMAVGHADPPSVCLQVNTSGEASKHGWSPDQILGDADVIAGCRAIPIVGLMTIAGLGTSAEEARPSFVRLREVRDLLRARTGLPLDALSMGMSNDFQVAIEEGATHVRVGSALFEGVGE